MKLFFTLFIFFAAVVGSQAQVTYFKATLDGIQEVPANASTASGVVIIKYTTATKLLELVGDFQNLSGPASAAHIHSPAAPGVNAPVLIGLTASTATTGTLGVNATLTAAQEIDLLAGNMYVNVHNTNFPGGEIRGQLTSTTSGQTDYLTGRIQSAQEVPPNGSLASGSVTVLSDKITGIVYLTGNFTGLTAAASAAHIHRASANQNGPVIIPLSVTAATSGTIHASSSVVAADQLLMTNGGTYVNIHNAVYPGGEIRGQLITQSQRVYLKAILQGSQEVPPNGSMASGAVIVTYNMATRLLELNGNYQGLTSAVTASHIHSPAAAGVNANVLVSLTNTAGTSGGLNVSTTLTALQEADLLGGLMYVNVHNANFPGGEIRGQLSTTTSGEQTQYLTGLLSGAQEVPANASAALGGVVVLVDRITNEVTLTGIFTGLTANASAAHIHGGAAGTNGGVVVGLVVTPATDGTLNGRATVRNSFADSMMLGLTYVNVHNASFPGGEIRAQLGNQVLPVKLNYFNGYQSQQKITLVWESAWEQQLQQYEVQQQSSNGRGWVARATVMAKGGSVPSKYSWVDAGQNRATAFVIYRLKMQDVDGKISYSPTLRINLKKSATTLNILANPVVGEQLQFVVAGLQSNSRLEATVIDMNGSVVARTLGSTLSNNAIEVGQLAAGIYRLLVRVNDETLQQVFKK